MPAGVPERYLKGGAFLFAAYGCALTERQTPGGTYVYTAVNVTTGKREILSHRKNKLNKAGFVGVAARINVSPVRGDSLRNIDQKPGKSALAGSLTETARHIFKEVLPQYGYAVRDNQIELADHILDVTGHRGVTLAESEVGTGKTHAYLIAAALAKRGRLNDFNLRGHYPQQSWAESAHMPVIISTSSIALQKAIERDYIPELSRIMLRHGIIQAPLTAAVRKGKEHYICERRLQRFLENADERARALLKPFAGAPFDLTDADSLSAYMRRGICVSGRCGDNCPYIGKCRYLRHMGIICDAKIDFQITNHNYFLADTLHRAGGKRPLLPHYQLVIIDEAHKFLAAARSMYGSELTGDELPELAREIHTFTEGKSGGGVNIHRLAKQMEEQSGKMFRRLSDNIPESGEEDDAERFPAVMDDEVCRYLRKLTGITGELAEAVADSRVRTLYRDRQAKAIWRLNTACECLSELRNRDRLIHWLERSADGDTDLDALHAIPKDLDERLHRDLWSGGVPIILTSGTLSAAGDFSRTKRTLGLDRLPERRLFSATMSSPFDYKNNALIYISENTPFPDNKDKRYIAAISDEIARLVLAAHGHAAVLFTSYSAMGQVYANLNRRGLPFPLFRLERGGVQAIDRFKKSGNGVLLASGALWEGIDIPGDTLSLLIIVKLPFAAPDPIGDYEKSLCGGMEKYKRLCVIPDMLVKDKQGFGRALRTELDTAVIAMLDSRLREGAPYRSPVLSSLPQCRVTSSIAAVGGFIQDKKSHAYFE
jgi:ATP-dependent DNA helicase DinG